MNQSSLFFSLSLFDLSLASRTIVSYWTNNSQERERHRWRRVFLNQSCSSSSSPFCRHEQFVSNPSCAFFSWSAAVHWHRWRMLIHLYHRWRINRIFNDIDAGLCQLTVNRSNWRATLLNDTNVPLDSILSVKANIFSSSLIPIIILRKICDRISDVNLECACSSCVSSREIKNPFSESAETQRTFFTYDDNNVPTLEDLFPFRSIDRLNIVWSLIDRSIVRQRNEYCLSDRLLAGVADIVRIYYSIER